MGKPGGDAREKRREKMKIAYRNQPLNLPRRRKDPAPRALAVISVVLAMMFAVRLIYDPHNSGLEELAVMAGAVPVEIPEETPSVPEADPVAACMASGGAVLPHDGAESSGYAVRADPFGSGEEEFHLGVDFAGEGAVRAWSDGTVRFTGEDESYGNYVVIDHRDGVSTLYAHLSRIDCGAGETVAAGEVIGIAGETGRATGVHLHFEIRVDGEPVDPEGYLEMIRFG